MGCSYYSRDCNMFDLSILKSTPRNLLRAMPEGSLMLDNIATVVAVILGVHAVGKFAFFALPYARRRAAVDKQYAGRATPAASRIPR